MNKLLVKMAILSISLLTVMASAAVSPALAKIRQAFPTADITLIKLVLTLPSLLIIPFSLLSGFLAARMKKKTVLLIGLVIYFLGGIGGGFAQNITQLLVIRGLFGIGVGLIIPLSTSLIADFYEGAERTKVMGLSGSVSHLGGVIFLLLSGWLACMSWRYAFGVYALSLITAVMLAVWLPESVSKKPAGMAKSKLPGGIYWCAVLGALMMVAFYAAPTNLAMFIENERKLYSSETPLFQNREELLMHLEKGTVSETARQSFKNNGIILSEKASLSLLEQGKAWKIADGNKKLVIRKEGDKLIVSSERLGRPGIAGYFLSTMTLIGVGSGIILATLLKIFGPFCPAVGIASMAVGYMALVYTTSLSGVLVAMICIGFSSGVLMPLLLLKTAKLAPETSRAFAMAVVSIGVYLGQFLSPVILKAAGTFFGTDVFRSQFIFLTLGLGIATILGVVSAVKTIKERGFNRDIPVKGLSH
jgi:MFS family permease